MRGTLITSPDVIAAVADWVVKDRVANYADRLFSRRIIKELVVELAHAAGGGNRLSNHQELWSWKDPGRSRGKYEIVAQLHHAFRVVITGV